MNDLQIDYFMAVATNQSFTKTSEELFVSQPAISRQIALLEKELGAQLFYRNNKETKLTEAGQLYYDYFRDMKLELRKLQHKVSKLQRKDKQLIRIGFLEGWDLSSFFHDFIVKMEEDFPNIEISVACCGIKELSTLLLTNNLDIVLSMKNSFRGLEEIKCQDVFNLRKIIIYSADSKYAKKDDVAPTDFKDELFIAPWAVADKIVSRAIFSYCEPYNFSPKVKLVHNNETMITFVRNNMGVAFSDMWAWAKGSDDLKWIPIEKSDKICIATMREQENDIINRVVDILADTIQSNLKDE
ncbi:MAG: LysR family transcriptional regulator [Clostridiales bacterium]|jgi:DNA-binding transcriptional LysR family regulator|nr:LysR family transcriptional regulator [Clostridiales bacterium]